MMMFVFVVYQWRIYHIIHSFIQPLLAKRSRRYISKLPVSVYINIDMTPKLTASAPVAQ